MIRDDIKAAQVAAMKAGDKARLGTIRLMLAKIKDRDIELRTGTAPADDDVLVTDVLQKMVKQRRESIAMYEQGGRQELADAEKAEVAVIERFLPQTLSEDETKAAIEAIKAEIGASGMKDMGRVMAELKARHATVLDMSKASGLVKAALASPGIPGASSTAFLRRWGLAASAQPRAPWLHGPAIRRGQCERVFAPCRSGRADQYVRRRPLPAMECC